MQNGITSLEDLFSVASNSFRIPQYQRAYSWEVEPHLEAFIEDLRQQVTSKKKYFLGTLLLHKEDVGSGNYVVNIVDGQQRLTTAVVFIATALSLKISLTKENPVLLKRNFVYDDATGCQKFTTITEDNAYFQSKILGISAAPTEKKSPSSERLQIAKDYFSKIPPAEWEDLLTTLKNAKVMVYVVDNAEDATQVFELQNDRGKRLTDLEALKSYLMHCIYLHSTKADDRLKSLQTQFERIYRTIEELGRVGGAPNEDQLLSNHCAAFLPWSENQYNDPKSLVKRIIKQLPTTEVVAWIENFVGQLVESYSTVRDSFARRDELIEFSELLILSRMGSFWPLVLKTWWYDKTSAKSNFRKACRLMEVFTFRGYAMAGLRSDTGLSTFYGFARDFTGSFPPLLQELKQQSFRHNNVEERFLAGLNDGDFYGEQLPARYLLWRYENHLRSKPGNAHPVLTWRDFSEPPNSKVRLSIEHIAARGSNIANTAVSWGITDAIGHVVANPTAPELKPFNPLVLNRLGNLVLDSQSPNSAKGDDEFDQKWLRISGGTKPSAYFSQGELLNFLKDPKMLVWDADVIRRRHNHLIDFAKIAWNPNTYLP